ncbi:AAA family ATPase [Neobacillus novalis]|uniref:histidine kinase n=1 Tax=Neobacillus novalis TaxID=220687 RepID=A0AA95MMP4_9BACI|nr:AAA family ATPase [Neobacillus novalis]WHY86536.1 AAA family ATPase [Neobacillus novalis]
MLKLTGFKELKKITADSFAEYYKGIFIAENEEIVIQKVVGLPYKADIEELQAFCELIAAINDPFFIKPIRLIQNGNHIMPVYKTFAAIPYKKLINTQSFSIQNFFVLAIQLCEILENIHAKGALLLQLNPYNLMIDLTNRRLLLLGLFHSISRGNLLRTYELPAEQIAYMAPEVSGRMNRKVDFRSNLYTLGIIFYEMLTNHLLFSSTDPLETIHAHFTRLPESPTDIYPEIPGVLSSIILKLLEKSPDDRYQSAASLKRDLKYCCEEYEKKGWIEDFPLGLMDNAKNFLKLDELYGRDQESNLLAQMMHHTLNGHQQTVFISGQSGSGKTALVRHLKNSSMGMKALFLEGKFDQLLKNIPYAPIAQALKTWVRIILSKGETNLSLWKQKIADGLGNDSGVMSAVLPEIEWIIGSQPMVEVLPSIESRSRLLMIFHKLINLITEENPLVLFIDDLQWADAASLELIEYLVSNVSTRNLFIILAFRDDSDLALNKAASAAIQKMHDSNKVHTSITLNHLQEEQVKQWVCDQYQVDDQNGEVLSTMIYNITMGNPFYITQLFHTIEKEKVISQSGSIKTIHFEMIKDLTISEDIVSYLVNRIKKQPKELQTLLKTASCLGQEFDIHILAALLNSEKKSTITDLLQGVKEGFLILSPVGKEDRDEERFLFIHDKVQQAMYSLLTEVEKQEIHLKIGKYLKNNKSIYLDNEVLFEAVSHLNTSAVFLNDEERKELASLNALAGEEAKKAAAFQSAYQYFLMARELLASDSWQQSYSLTYQITKGFGETAYLNSHFPEAETAFDEVLAKAHSREEKLKLYNLKITLFTHLHRVKDAVDAGIKGLQLYDWEINSNPGKIDIVMELIRIQLAFRNKNPLKLMDLPVMKDDTKKELMQTLININAPAFHVNQNLATSLMLKAFTFTLKNGQTDISSLVFNNFSLIQGAGFGNFRRSFEFGKLAIQHAEKSNSKSLKARVYFVNATFVNHWKNHLQENLFYLYESQKYSVESGNIHLAGAASSFIIMTLLLKGEGLQEVLAGVNQQLEFVRSINYRLSVDFMNEMKHWLDVLLSFNIEPIFDLPISNDDDSGYIVHFTLRLQMAYLLKEKEQAIKLLEKLSTLIDHTNVLVITPDYYFYRTLWLSRICDKCTIREKKKHIRNMRKNIKKMKKWAKCSPTNYKHKYYLMEAELFRVLKKSKEEIDSYFEKAIFYAIENNFKQDIAIIYECAGNYSISTGYVQLGRYYLKLAHEHYMLWGAVRKADHLLLEFPEIAEPLNKTKGIVRSNLNIDVETILKSAQAISKEIHFGELIVTMITTLLKNAGAEKGFLLLYRNNELDIVVKRDLDGSFITDLPGDINELSDEVPLQLIHYVYKTREHVVLENATLFGLFVDDPYIRKSGPKSVLSLPICHQNQLIAILYLENNLISHAFTEEHIQTLTMLSSQAAISIENARIYATLEDKIKERTADLEHAIERLAETNKKLQNEEALRRDLLSNISHDLRTPITSVQGYIEAIIDGIVDTPEQQLVYLKRTRERIYSLNRLIQDLFDLSQLTAGNINFSMENVAADKLFLHLCGQYEWDVTKNGLEFKASDPLSQGRLYPLVNVDIGRIDQVISNLIGNSIKHTAEGMIHMQLLFEEKSDHVTFAIHDSGSGINPDDLENIFERSYTKKGHTSKEGHGLGLAICKEIISFHKGLIWAESEPGKGTSIYFTIPAVQLNESELLVAEQMNK